MRRFTVGLMMVCNIIFSMLRFLGSLFFSQDCFGFSGNFRLFGCMCGF